MNHSSYYETLGIDKSATKEEIKNAFRVCSKQYHPDANPAPNAALIFRMMVEAKEVLLDDEKRTAYDKSLNTTSRTEHRHYEEGYAAWWDEGDSSTRDSHTDYQNEQKKGSAKKNKVSHRTFKQRLIRLPITISVLFLRAVIYFLKVIFSILLVPAGCVIVVMFGFFAIVSIFMAIYVLTIIFGSTEQPLGMWLLMFGISAGITAILNPLGGPLPFIVESIYSGLERASEFLEDV